MSIRIKVEDNPYQEKLITLNGVSLYITIMYNTSDDVNDDGFGSWYFDLADRNKDNIVSGVKILPLQNLTERYLSVNKILNGDLWCVNVKDSSSDIGRENFSTDGEFQLWYFSEEEMTTYGIK